MAEEHLRTFLFYFFKKHINSGQARHNIYKTEASHSILKRSVWLCNLQNLKSTTVVVYNIYVSRQCNIQLIPSFCGSSRTLLMMKILIGDGDVLSGYPLLWGRNSNQRKLVLFYLKLNFKTSNIPALDLTYSLVRFFLQMAVVVESSCVNDKSGPVMI